MEGKMLAWADEPDTEMITKLLSLPFEQKEKIARDIVKDSIANADNPFVCFSGGKKSTVLLHLIKNLSFKKKALPKKYLSVYRKDAEIVAF